MFKKSKPKKNNKIYLIEDMVTDNNGIPIIKDFMGTSEKLIINYETQNNKSKNIDSKITSFLNHFKVD
ncbi:MAG: hypothetical protein A2Y17_01475 [Clostridiales bacterium GWF2_38_85]|nr:MAG: hypothetical protein A2Y17_01475 [Clostridiales bacterium GWF2_38_85]HBL85190.1 hypothetical protein [Clostridiales bacterium]